MQGTLRSRSSRSPGLGLIPSLSLIRAAILPAAASPCIFMYGVLRIELSLPTLKMLKRRVLCQCMPGLLRNLQGSIS